MRLVRARRGLVGLLAATAGVVAVSGWASASIPDAETQAFHGCVDNKSGALRVIDPSKGAACRRWEQPITWNAHPVEDRELEVVNQRDVLPSLTALPYVGADGTPVPPIQRFPVFTFQPDSIVSWHEDQSLEWPVVDPTGLRLERKYAGTTGRVVTIVAEFTAEKPLVPGTQPVGTITPYLDALREKAGPQSDTFLGGTLGPGPLPPPNVLLTWGPPVGGINMTGVITELHIVHTQMSGLGEVTEARVSMTIAELVRPLLASN
jgi:hypothetical protein